MKEQWCIRNYALDTPPEAFGPFADFARLWETKYSVARQHGKKLPAWKDFDFFELRPWWGMMSLLEHEESTGRFRNILWGTQLSEWFGADFTNRYVDEVFKTDPKRLESGIQHLHSVFEDGTLSFWHDVLTHMDRGHVFIMAMELPLSRNGKTPTHMLNTIIRSTNEDSFWPAAQHIAEFVAIPQAR